MSHFTNCANIFTLCTNRLKLSSFHIILAFVMEEYKDFDIIYGYDFKEINAPELRGCCIHLICLEGEGSFVLNERCFHVSKSDIVVSTRTDLIKNIANSPEMKVEFLAAPTKTLNYLLPANNFGIGGAISLFQNPIIKVSPNSGDIFLADIRRIRERVNEESHAFQKEVIGSLCLTMMYDLFGFHSKHYTQVMSTDRTGAIVKGFIALLEGMASQSHRDVKFYADQLHVSVKYLENTVRRITGASVMSYIDRYTVPMITTFLKDDQLSFTQISEKMNFTSLSYFSRYVTKHLGMSPSQYRQTKSPKK